MILPEVRVDERLPSGTVQLRDGDEVIATLHDVQDASDDLQPEVPPTLEEMLEAIPLNVILDPDVDLDVPDPCLTDSGKRFCISTRRAGGRCTAPPGRHSLLCNMHSGLVDPAAGGKARARNLRETREDQAERSRLARLGPRGVILDTVSSHPLLLQRATLVLLEDAAAGDKGAAKLLGPYLNQALGMPRESVELSRPEGLEDLDRMSTRELEEWVAARRPARALGETR